jgi:glutathione S-transferase
VPGLTLVIGNKNYSSWSLRAWIALKHLGLAFAEKQILLDTPQFASEVAVYGAAGRVPILLHGDLTVWDSLAICEYGAELAGRGWPRDSAVRAVARSVSAEMHSGFAALRSQWPMNVRAHGRRTPMTPALAADVARIDRLWNACRQRSPDAGPWLFGEWSIADAMYAPVVMRLRTYGAELSAAARDYCATWLRDAHLAAWIEAARTEPWIVAADEAGASDG